jgi:high-affinity iron transporter
MRIVLISNLFREIRTFLLSGNANKQAGRSWQAARRRWRSNMFSTLMVNFREGVEAFLIVAVTLLYLRQTQRTQLVPALRWGVISAVVLSIVLGLVLARVGAMQPIHEAWLALAAFVLVLSCTVHMLRHGKRIAAEIRAKVDAASAKAGVGASAAVFLFVFLMIGHEGVETATMLASMANSTDLQHFAVGGVIGVLLAALLALAWVRFGKRINLSRFFQVTAVFMVLFSIQLLVYEFHEFTEAGAIPGVDNQYWHVVSEPYGPEGEYGAWLSHSLVLVPMLFLVFAWLQDRPHRLTHALQRSGG